MIKKYEIGKINSYLLILLGFLLPITVAGANIAVALIVILWIVEGDFKRKYLELKDNKVVLASLAFVLMHIIALLWSDDIKWGLNIIKKEAIFLVLPILMSVVRKEHMKHYIIAFLLAISIDMFISYGIWLELLQMAGTSVLNPTPPYISHISYNPYLAFGVYIALFLILFNDIERKYKNILFLLVILMSISMFITGGRAGQVVYVVLVSLILLHYYQKSIGKAILISIATIIVVFTVAYNSSTIFEHRVHESANSINELITHDSKEVLQGSISLRVGFAINSFNIWMDNFLIGVGSGDFPQEYKEYNVNSNYKTFEDTQHPHNMYLLVAVQSGVVGLLLLLSIIYYELKYAIDSKDEYRPMRYALPIMFIFLMFSDSYLLGHYTTMMFIFFSAILFHNKKELNDGLL
jgi:O-antigen ligase